MSIKIRKVWKSLLWFCHGFYLVGPPVILRRSVPDPFAWFLIGMLLGILGLLLLFLLPPLTVTQENKTARIEESEPISDIATDHASPFRLKEWFYLDEEKRQLNPFHFIC